MSTQSNSKASFPSHLIDPRRKNKEWILNYLKAAWSDFSTVSNIFYYKGWKYNEIKDYALGNQSIDQYKKILKIGDSPNGSWVSIDWRVLPIVTKFRRIALNKLKKVNYDIDAVAVDSLAVDEKEKYIAEQKAKLAIREAVSKTDPQLAEQLKENGDVEDFDELKVKELYTYKHNATVEMESGIDLVFKQNNIDYLREQIREDLFDYGVAGTKDWIDSNGAVRCRRVNPSAVITNYCKENDFSDKQYAGEVIRMTIADLKQSAGNQFVEDEYKEIAENVINKYGNPNYLPKATVYSNGYDDFNIDVLDMEFYSVNEAVYEKRRNARGNPIFGRVDYNKRESDSTPERHYKRVAYKVVYKGSWIIGTNYLFNYGLATNMKRVKNNMMETEMSYHFYAPEFYNMEAKGITEQLIPLANAVQIAWYRLQNAINQARPKGIEIDIDGIEDINLGGGGENMTASEVIDMFNETGTLVYRRKGQGGALEHYRPIQEIENGLGKDAIIYYDIIQRNIQMIRDITGLNELVDGSTPDARTLTTVANMAQESSNNALGDVISGDQHLLSTLGNSVYLRLQDAVTFGNIEGYVKSLGSNSVKFIRVTKNIANHVFGIFLRLRMSDEQRLQFKTELKEMANAGIIDPDTAITIGNIENKDQAEQVLAYMVKRTRERKLKEAQQQMATNGKIQQESAQAQEQAKQQTIALENKGKLDEENARGQWKLKAIEAKGQIDKELAGISNQGKHTNTAIQHLGRMAEQEQQGVKNVNKEPPE